MLAQCMLNSYSLILSPYWIHEFEALHSYWRRWNFRSESEDPHKWPSNNIPFVRNDYSYLTLVCVYIYIYSLPPPDKVNSYNRINVAGRTGNDHYLLIFLFVCTSVWGHFHSTEIVLASVKVPAGFILVSVVRSSVTVSAQKQCHLYTVRQQCRARPSQSYSWSWFEY